MLIELLKISGDTQWKIGVGTQGKICICTQEKYLC